MDGRNKRSDRSDRSSVEVRHGPRHRPRRPAVLLACLPPAMVALAGCGVVDTGPVEAGAPAQGPRVAERADVLRVYFLTPHGAWPVARPEPAGSAGPQAVLDALLAGPTRSERARGLVTALPAGTHRVRARASTGAVDLYLPWLVPELDRVAVNQLVCTAAAAPGVPGGRKAADVVVRIHESGISGDAWPVRCDEDGAAAPVETSGPAR